MKRTFLVFLFATQIVVSSSEDPHLWLEEIESEQALNWVKKENNETLTHMNRLYSSGSPSVGL